MLLGSVAIACLIILFAFLFSHSASTSSPAGEAQRIAHVPIFTYHLVRMPYADDTPALRNYLVTSGVFDQQMSYLRDNGYHVVTFSDLEDYLDAGIPLPSKPVILSFDDGWVSQFTDAFPILQKYHFRATFFIFTNPIGEHGFMTWDEIRALSDSGMVIGSHSRSHPFLAKITYAPALWDEIANSKKIIESHTGATTNEFAYPFGSYNRAVIADVVKAGYKAARIFSTASTSPIHTAAEIYTLTTFMAPKSLSDFEKDLSQ